MYIDSPPPRSTTAVTRQRHQERQEGLQAVGRRGQLAQEAPRCWEDGWGRRGRGGQGQPQHQLSSPSVHLHSWSERCPCFVLRDTENQKARTTQSPGSHEAQDAYGRCLLWALRACTTGGFILSVLLTDWGWASRTRGDPTSFPSSQHLPRAQGPPRCSCPLCRPPLKPIGGQVLPSLLLEKVEPYVSGESLRFCTD